MNHDLKNRKVIPQSEIGDIIDRAGIIDFQSLQKFSGKKRKFIEREILRLGNAKPSRVNILYNGKKIIYFSNNPKKNGWRFFPVWIDISTLGWDGILPHKLLDIRQQLKGIRKEPDRSVAQFLIKEYVEPLEKIFQRNFPKIDSRKLRYLAKLHHKYF